MMRRRTSLIFLALMIAALAGCGVPNMPAETPTPTTPALIGDVRFIDPAPGTIIYSETLRLGGTASDLPADGFSLQLLVDETPIVDTIVQPDGESWSLELVHGYAGEPIEATLIASSPNPLVMGDYDRATVVLASLEYRPEGAFGALLFPTDGLVLGGDVIQVSGTASGIPDNTLTVILENDGGILDEQTVQVDNPYHIDEIPWQIDLATQGATGPATVRVFYLNDAGEAVSLGEVSIMLSVVAG